MAPAWPAFSVRGPRRKGAIDLGVGEFRAEQQDMSENPDAKGQFVKVINARVHFLSLQGANVGSLQPALQAQFLLGPLKQGAGGAQIRCQANARCCFLDFLGHPRKLWNGAYHVAAPPLLGLGMYRLQYVPENALIGYFMPRNAPQGGCISMHLIAGNF